MAVPELGLSEAASRYLKEISRVFALVPLEPIEQAILRLDRARLACKTVFTCGNGGSAATASHFASDLSKGALAPGKAAFRAICLSDNVPLLTAWSNDVHYEYAFAERLKPWVSRGDVLVAISGSGNSKNLLNAVDVAKSAGAFTIGLAGFDGGKLKDAVDLAVVVPCYCMEQVEDVHLCLCHLISTCLRSLPGEGVLR